jgi:hypothetical protein
MGSDTTVGGLTNKAVTTEAEHVHRYPLHYGGLRWNEEKASPGLSAR